LKAIIARSLGKLPMANLGKSITIDDQFPEKTA
jgi:hypothetical protein